MVKSDQVRLLYTAHIEGHLALLPRLFSLIERERQAAPGVSLLLDLGDSCAQEVPLCQATRGRAPLLVMDGMGYDLALVGAGEHTPIPPDALRQLLGQLIMPIAIGGRPRQVTQRGVGFTLVSHNGQSEPDQAATLPTGPVVQVLRGAPTLPVPGSSPPVLGDVPRGHLACVDLRWRDDEHTGWHVVEARLMALADDIPPDPTISALVELVQEEASAFDQGPPDAAPPVNMCAIDRLNNRGSR